MIRQKFFFVIFIFFFSFLYVWPNVYGEKPVIMIDKSDSLPFKTLGEAKDYLTYKKIFFYDVYNEKKKFIIYFNNTEEQFNAFENFKNNSIDNISLNIKEIKETFLFKSIRIKPMSLGLDLRGGIYFLVDINFKSNIKDLLKMYVEKVRNIFDDNKFLYKKIVFTSNNFIKVYFNDNFDSHFLKNYLLDFDIMFVKNKVFYLKLKDRLLYDFKKQIVDQTVYIFNKRINELGISDSLVRKKGLSKIAIEISGMQDISRAKKIIGKIATLNFMLVANDLLSVDKNYIKRFVDKDNNELFLLNKSLLDGRSIINATQALDSFNKPCINIKIKQSDAEDFENITSNNIGKNMAIVYKEIVCIDNEEIITEKIISVARIMSSLSNNFQITGLNMEEAKDLSLLLRSGSLPASVSILEEKVIGPSIGEKNVKNGMVAILISYFFIFFFMFYRYKILGLIANFSLLANIFLLIMLMSIINFTLTLPGLAGIAITIGMGIDGNILIFERFREEFSKSSNMYINLENGFNNSFSSIFDSNLTTLIIGLVLFILGDGFIKGFAITLSLGILTSMYSSLFVTKVFIDFFSLLKIRLI